LINQTQSRDWVRLISVIEHKLNSHKIFGAIELIELLGSAQAITAKLSYTNGKVELTFGWGEVIGGEMTMGRSDRIPQ